MRKKMFFVLLALCVASWQVAAQRQTERLDRGLVSVNKGSGNIYVSWRYFATDADSMGFNLYYTLGGSVPTPTKLNSSPITSSTNWEGKLSGTNASGAVVSVRPVVNGVEGSVEGSWTTSSEVHRIVQDFTFEPLPLTLHDTLKAKFTMKFCWPVDLNGDGKYDFVMDRQCYGEVTESGDDADGQYPPPYIEAYEHSGAFKWRVAVGPNVMICSGHADMVIAYDMDGDGKAEVMLKTSEGTTFADGTVITGAGGQVKDYRLTNEVAPHYISIINGETGNEIHRITMTSSMHYLTKPDLYGTWNYKQLSGHFGIAYLDGLHPSLLFEQSNRNSDGSFNFMVTAWDYRNHQLVERWSWDDVDKAHAHFHQIRIADVDGDGFDEMIEGAFAIDHDGKPLFNTDLIHGDRHHTTDIDPDRPGLETFAIQQDNMTTLGMALYGADDGAMIKRWYQSGVGDVGRGVIGDIDSTVRGVEMWSTMANYYDCKGNLFLEASTLFPPEAIWWDGDLGREMLSPIGSSGASLDINKWNSQTKAFDRYRGNPANTFENRSLYNEKANYYTKAMYGGRPAFIGDILGDWREELVLMRSDNTGFCVMTTSSFTNKRIYCLMQNPAYRMQATTKGYYQAPYVDYYLAYDMPAPPIAPVQSANLYYASGSSFATANFVDSVEAAKTYADGKTVMFDVRGAQSSITLSGSITPKKLWVINPKGKDYTFEGSGIFTGSMELVKSLQGTLTLNGSHSYTGVTRISEGKIVVNGTLASKVYVGARGIIGGNARLNGGIELDEGLNYLGARVEPGNGCEASKLGVVVINGSVNGKGRSSFAFDVVPGSTLVNDTLRVIGDFNVAGKNNTIEVNFKDNVFPEGNYTLITFSGSTNATAASFVVRGIEFVPFELVVEAHAVKLRVDQSRNASSVVWTGAVNGVWDFKTANFKLGSSPTIAAPGDSVLFLDDAVNKTITITEQMPLAQANFELVESTYIFDGVGGIGSSCVLTQTGGTLKINTNNTYTGMTRIIEGTMEVKNLANAGETSSVGSGDSIAISFATLKLVSVGSFATNRGISMSGDVNIDIVDGASLMLSNNIRGDNANFVKTGKGLLNIQGSNTFRSATIQDGTIFCGNTAASIGGFGSSQLRLLGGTLRLLDTWNMDAAYSCPFNVEVPASATARMEVSSRASMSGSLVGSGTLNLLIPSVRFDFNGDWSQFEGNINVVKLASGLTSYATGEFRINNTYGYGKASIHLSDNTVMYPNTAGRIIAIGGLSGDVGGRMTGKNTWVIGGNNASTTYAGIIADAGNISKEGSGTFTISNNGSAIGDVSVNEGTLSFTHSGQLVNSGTYTNTATTRLALGASVKVGAFATSGALSIALGADNSAARIVSGAAVSLGGRLNLEVSGSSIFVSGARFTLFSGRISGTFSSISPELPVDLDWDQSEIGSGVLKISAAHTVRYVSNGIVVDSFKVVHNATITKPADPVRENYNFMWWNNGEAEYSFAQPVVSDLTLTAVWETITYRIIFVGWGKEISRVNVVQGDTVARPVNPADSTGFRFLGWYISDNELYNFGAPVTARLQIVARWEMKSYVVDFVNGGRVLSSVSVNHGGVVARPGELDSVGFNFIGWYVSDSALYDFEAPIIGDVLLVARWEVKEVTGADAAAMRAIRIYPNPVVDGEMIVDNEDVRDGDRVEVYNVYGVLVKTFVATGSKTVVSVLDLVGGTYVVRVGNRSGRVVKR